MVIEHEGKRPKIYRTVFVRPSAIGCGDGTIGENNQILFGNIINGIKGILEIHP